MCCWAPLERHSVQQGLPLLPDPERREKRLYLPLQILLLGFLFQAVLPVMQRQHWLPEQLPGGRLRW